MSTCPFTLRVPIGGTEKRRTFLRLPCEADSNHVLANQPHETTLPGAETQRLLGEGWATPSSGPVIVRWYAA